MAEGGPSPEGALEGRVAPPAAKARGSTRAPEVERRAESPDDAGPARGLRRLAGVLRAGLLWLLLAVSAPQLTVAQPLRPVDEAAPRPDFLAFRARLQATLSRHDVAALRAVVHPGIKNSFGGDDGIAGFEATWRPEDPGSAVWETLARVLALGGSFDPDGRFVAPYVFSRGPEGVDAFEHLAVVGRGVRVRAEPRADAMPLGSLDHVIVRAAAEQPKDEAWRAVRLPDGRVGFVSHGDVRSPIDYRAAFERIGGRWRMTLFLAGD